MLERLSYSPLTYVLMQVKISDIPHLREEYIPKIHNSIRKEFPFKEEKKFNTIQIGQQGSQTNFELKPLEQWHFIDKPRTTGIVIDSNSIMLHTTAYETFGQLMSLAKEILKKLNKVMEISLYTRIGLRYINLIQSSIETHVNQKFLGFYIPELGKNYKIKTETSQEAGEKTVLRTCTVREYSSNVSAIPYVPMELTSANSLSFEHQNLPKSGEYLILDFDCFSNNTSDFKTVDIEKCLIQLHKNIQIAFQSSVTKEALSAWR